MKLDIQAICHKGLVRENNEDALSIGGLLLRDDSTTLTVSTPEDGFFYLLVSDGMGGHDDGEEASRFALDEIKEQLAWREANRERAAQFRTTRAFGERTKLLLMKTTGGLR